MGMLHDYHYSPFKFGSQDLIALGRQKMFKGETVASGAPLPYPEAQPEVLKSGAGYYIGYQSQYGEPYSR